MDPTHVLDAATDLRERYDWLDELIVRLIGPDRPGETRHEWLNRLSIGFHGYTTWLAECRAYEDRHPEPRAMGEAVWEEWKAGLPPAPKFTEELLHLGTKNRLVVLLVMSLNTNTSSPGWRAIDIHRLTERELPFFRDWLKIVGSQAPRLPGPAS